MNNFEFYSVLSVKRRRKHIAAVCVSPEVSEQELPCSRDKNGWLQVDLSLMEDGIIAEGMRLDFEELRALTEESYRRKAKDRALWYLSAADHSKKGLKRKLTRYFPEYAADFAVDRMCELGYINDEKYAKNTCEILNARGMSANAIVSKLVASGVPSQLAKEVVRESDTDQVGQIELLIEKKYKNKLGDEDSVRRTVNSLARRGFSFSDIKTAIKKYTDTDFNEEC